MRSPSAPLPGRTRRSQSLPGKRGMVQALERSIVAAGRVGPGRGAVMDTPNGLFALGSDCPSTAFSPWYHAEAWAMRNAASLSPYQSLFGSTLYVSTRPCSSCASLARDVGVKRIVVLSSFRERIYAAWLRLRELLTPKSIST